MDEPSRDVMRIEGEMATGIGHVRLVRSFWDAPIDKSAAIGDHHLQLSLMPTSGSAEGCFFERWGPHRFEPIGEMFFLPSGEYIRTRSNCRDQNAIVCTFIPGLVEQWFGSQMHWTDGRLQAMLDIANANIRRLLFRMGEEIRSPSFETATMVELLARQVAIELARHCQGLEGDQATGGLAPWRLRLIDERLANGTAAPSLEELATLCNISVRHLTRAFRISRGRSIGGYIAEHRVDEAKNLLAAGMSVKEVAFAMGFTAPSNFAVAFRRATGETPRDYRQRASRKQMEALVKRQAGAVMSNRSE